MDERLITEEILAESRKFARDFLSLRDSDDKSSSGLSLLTIHWQEYKNSLTIADRKIAMRAFREVLGEE